MKEKEIKSLKEENLVLKIELNKYKTKFKNYDISMIYKNNIEIY